MAGTDRIIQNSEVYVLTSSQSHQAQPPPSPPTPCETRTMSPVSEDMPMTPPSVIDPSPLFEKRLSTAVHVLGTEATALSFLTRLYQVDPVARDGFDGAVEAITHCMSNRGKIVMCGVGKSGHIAKKLVATMNSLRIAATFLHPTEALHGDLGKVGDDDVILLITFSGRTPELLSLIPHFSPSIPILIITSHTQPSTCPLTVERPDAILLPAPTHEPESFSFGVSAPTTSTTIALALGDALAVAVSNEVHQSVQEVFSRNHPGGAIGEARQESRKMLDIMIPLRDIPNIDELTSKAGHVILAAYQSTSGWVRSGSETLFSPRTIRKLRPEEMDRSISGVKGLAIASSEWIFAPARMGLPEGIVWIKDARRSSRYPPNAYDDATILAARVDGEVRVCDIGDLMTSLGT